ncbi:hypothetical protein P4E94_19830 [Pontiellaceae bacterium B12219]|nr:hypothetical protein [Pontiellaceae bacterium B12219]
MNKYGQSFGERVADARRADAFAEIDRRVIAKMKDKDLALWQSEYPPDSPQFILAEFEWNRRLTAEQIRSTR